MANQVEKYEPIVSRSVYAVLWRGTFHDLMGMPMINDLVNNCRVTDKGFLEVDIEENHSVLLSPEKHYLVYNVYEAKFEVWEKEAFRKEYRQVERVEKAPS